MPSGFLECGESLEECAVRELAEETGLILDAGSVELYSIKHMTSLEQVAVALRVTLTVAPKLHPGPECLDVAFKSQADIMGIDFAWRRSMGDSLEILFREMQSGKFSIKLATLGLDDGVGFKSHKYTIESVCSGEVKGEDGAGV